MTTSTTTAEYPVAHRSRFGPGVVLGLAGAALAAMLVYVAVHAGGQAVVAAMGVLVAGAGLQRVCHVAARAAREQVVGPVALVMAIYVTGSIVLLLVASQVYL